MLELGPDEVPEHHRLGELVAEHAALVGFLGPRSRAAQASAEPTLGTAARHFDELESLLGWLQGELRAGDVVLVKASRGMRLERLVDALTGAPAGAAH
jgi:UDP-N-acetylmuramoyl-tripeptide--D-alanyl-D-alanine ligase